MWVRVHVWEKEEKERERERESVCVCVWERKRESVCERKKNSVYVCECERKSEEKCVLMWKRECECVWEREWEKKCVCLSERKRVRENIFSVSLQNFNDLALFMRRFRCSKLENFIQIRNTKMRVAWKQIIPFYSVFLCQLIVTFSHFIVALNIAEQKF